MLVHSFEHTFPVHNAGTKTVTAVAVDGQLIITPVRVQIGKVAQLAVFAALHDIHLHGREIQENFFIVSKHHVKL